LLPACRAIAAIPGRTRAWWQKHFKIAQSRRSHRRPADVPEDLELLDQAIDDWRNGGEIAALGTQAAHSSAL
jgi:hypothetical protein